MPRPANGYVNAADQPVPGVHDITGRYKEMGGLMQWAYSQGKKGVPLYSRDALDIGTAVHRMAELDLRGARTREIECIPHETLQVPEHIDKAFQAFGQFQAWRKEHSVRAVSMEESLVSEEFQYGGTLDVVALIDGYRGLLDFKTCKTAGQIYLEQRLVMAAHGRLWHERHPDLPLSGYHLINLPKDGSRFGHHAFADLSPEWEMFTLQLDCWRIEKGLSRKRSETVGNGRKTGEKPLETGQKRSETGEKPARNGRKRSETVKPALPPPSMQDLTMAELLRSYGHVKEAA